MTVKTERQTSATTALETAFDDERVEEADAWAVGGTEAWEAPDSSCGCSSGSEWTNECGRGAER